MEYVYRVKFVLYLDVCAPLALKSKPLKEKQSDDWK